MITIFKETGEKLLMSRQVYLQILQKFESLPNQEIKNFLYIFIKDNLLKNEMAWKIYVTVIVWIHIGEVAYQILLIKINLGFS